MVGRPGRLLRVSRESAQWKDASMEVYIIVFGVMPTRRGERKLALGEFLTMDLPTYLSDNHISRNEFLRYVRRNTLHSNTVQH